MSTLRLVTALLGLLSLVACSNRAPPEPRPLLPYADSPWSTLHADSRNSDYAPVTVQPRPRVEWEALDGAALYVGPTLGPALAAADADLAAGRVQVARAQPQGLGNPEPARPAGRIASENDGSG